MKAILIYCYYKTSKFYKTWGEKGYSGTGKTIVFGSIALNLLSILTIVSFFTRIRIISIEIIPIVFILSWFWGYFYMRGIRYEDLEMKYYNESNSTIKGWIVFGYYLLSTILYALCLIYFN